MAPVARGQRPVDRRERCRCLPVNATPAIRGWATKAAPTAPSPGSNCSTPAGKPVSIASATARAPISGVCSAGFANDSVARRECGGDLAEEYRERKVPRTDAGEHAAAVQTQFVRLTRRTRQPQRFAELLRSKCRVVAAVVDRLAHFCHCVGNRLAAFTHQQRDQYVAIGFEAIGQRDETTCPLRAAEPIPARLRRLRCA